MSSIICQKVGIHTYIYLIDSKWNIERKYSDNIRNKIGQIDLDSGKALFLPEFLESLSDNQPLLERIKNKFPNSVIDIADKNADVLPKKIYNCYPGDSLNLGKTLFLYHIADNIGLLDLLKESFPSRWKQILTIATFLIFEDKAYHEIDDFIKDNITFNVGTLSSQRTSELLANFNSSDYNNFLKKWYERIKDNEYIAFDSTNISSYSQNNELVEYGKAKDNPELKQVNLCLLYGEKSKLPVYQTVYSGSLNDVSVILDIISEFRAIVGTSKILIVNDKGFYSKKNVLGLLKFDTKFLLAVPFNNKDANDIYDKLCNSQEFLATSAIIKTNHNCITGITKLLDWYGSTKLHTHIFFDCLKHTTESLNFKEELKELKQSYLQGPLSKKDQEQFDKYLIINPNVSEKSKHYIIDNTEEIENYLKHVGYLILISNHTKDAQEAHYIYVNKDCVEKSFMSYKQNLGMDRIHTGSSKRFTSKAIIAFIALILDSHIHHVMSVQNIYKEYHTKNKMLAEINRIKVFLDHDGKYQLKTLTKKQKDILTFFNLEIPNTYSINYFIKKILK
jgi:transposase